MDNYTHELIEEQKERIESRGNKKYFYISIPAYNHEVFKCSGQVGDDDHKDFYINHFLNNKESVAIDQETKVLIVQGYRGDRFDLNGNVAIGYDRYAYNQGDVSKFILETHTK